MSHFEFVIPLKKDELLESHAGKYCVEDVVQPRLLLSKLQDAARAYNSDGVLNILEHFDTYFSIIVHGNKLEWNVINKGFDHLSNTVKNLCIHLEAIFQDQEIDENVRVKNLNLIKMTMYLFTHIMKVKDTKLAADNSTKLTLGKKSKKAVDNEEFCGWTESDKQAALVTLHLVLQLPLSRLWDPPLAEDNFVSLVAEPCYKALEEQIIKNKAVRETVFQVLGVLIKKYNHGTSCLIKLVQVLQMVENAVSPICAGVVQLTKEFGLTTFGPQMVREIAEALASTEEDNAGAGTEQASARNCGAFLLELTKELPKEMTSAIATLQPYLESDESYTLRISVLGMMCEALAAELHGEGLADEQRIQRDDFLDDLYEHMHDLSAYVRHKVLQFWCRLQRDNCVPVTRQRAVLERAVGRLRDKAALVRKAAIQLLKIFLECNPFSAQLKLEILEEQLATETKILENLQKTLNPGPDAELMKKWESIEKVVVETIKNKMNVLTQDEPALSQASLDNLYDAIRRHLREGDYHKAYLVVKHTERLYPEARLLRCEMQKSDQLEYFIALLRNIYVIPCRKDCDSLTQNCENELALYKKLEEKEGIVAFLQESVHFCRVVSEAVPLINSLLMSKQAGDVNEAIEFFTAAHHFNIESAKLGVANMLLLVWSPDQEKREAVERAYRDMYLECDSKTERARAVGAARRLLALARHVDRGAALALQGLVDKWLQKGDIQPALIQVFWEIFLKKLDGTTDADSYAALSFLVMIAKAKPSVALANLEVILKYGFTGDYHSRDLSAQLLQALAKKEQRYPADHAIFETLVDSLMETFTKIDEFASFAANSIDLIYAICDVPDAVCIKLLSEMYKEVEKVMVKNAENEEDVSVPTELLTRFVFVLGHVALQQLIYLDINVYSELRRRNQVREERKAEEKRKKKAGALATPARRGRGRADELRRQTLLNASAASASSRGQRSASVTSKRTSMTNTTMTEEEAGMEGAAADDADAEFVRGVCERDVVGAGAALARYEPLLRWLLLARLAPSLQAAAALTFTRFMLVSSSMCEDGLQLMVTILKKSKNVALRTNLTIAFADLTLRFPNLTQPWTHHIYHILSDEELEVRQCAVKMLSFLVLHEMVRVKGQIADMALCCADADARVAAMTRLFFKQLSLKGNALYNVMPDIISRLSDPELGVPEPQYRLIMKYITSLIQKDRQMEALVEKLCQRFKLSTEERQWRDLAYCLSLFTYNERALRKLLESVDCYRDKLHCAGVMESFNALMNNAARNAKNEIKSLVTELGDKIEECFAVGAGDDDGEGTKAGAASPASATPRRRPAPRRQRRRSSSSPDEMTQGGDFVSLASLLEERGETDMEDEVLERIKVLAQENLPAGWTQWEVVRSSKEDIFGPRVEAAVLNKVSFALPTVGLTRCFDPDADHLSEKGYREIRRNLLDWAFTRALILGPPSIVNRVHGSAMRAELFKQSIEPIRPLLHTRAEANGILSGCRSESEETGRRSRSIASFCSEETVSRRRKRDGTPDEAPRPKKSKVEVLEERMNNMFSILADKIDALSRPTEQDDSDKENIESEEEDALSDVSEERSSAYWRAPDFGLPSANEDTDLDFLPKVKEAEPLIPEPSPQMKQEGISCQRLGSEGWNRIRYKEVEKLLHAAPVFSSLKVNNELAGGRTHTSWLSKQEGVLGTITHGLLKQRKVLSDGLKRIATDFPEAADAIKKLLADGSEVRSVSDNLLQFVCAHRAEAIELRRRVFKHRTDALNAVLHQIPPSATHLFDEKSLSSFIKDNGQVYTFGSRPLDRRATTNNTFRKPMSSQQPTGKRKQPTHRARPANNANTANSRGFPGTRVANKQQQQFRRHDRDKRPRRGQKF